ncbi:hypothetical protein NE237_026935 [Protea cynaroides]|uniref:MSP domain-containing protein n=1 Tax=Protea cynaroides TaxID=273540 RepID=A0A9Q0JTY4_9MAGN|nr:hypothetical protein NE237_026935 [Protea cynaroides]
MEIRDLERGRWDCPTTLLCINVLSSSALTSLSDSPSKTRAETDLVSQEIKSRSLPVYRIFGYTDYSFSPPENYFRGSLDMTSGGLVSIEPQELTFPFELKKQISCSLQLSNKTDNYVAFKVKTTNPKKYCVRPNTGIVLPRSTSDVIVTMQAQREAPPDMQCKDKFLLQCAIASPGATAKDITPEMFNKESGNHVEESKLRVVYVSPPQPPSPVPEGSEEGSSPRASVSDNGNVNTPEFSAVSRAHVEPQSQVSRGYTESQDKSSEARALISKLTEEKNSAMQHNNKLRQELELLRRQGMKSSGGIPFLYVVIVALLGILLGYLLRKT